MWQVVFPELFRWTLTHRRLTKHNTGAQARRKKKRTALSRGRRGAEVQP